MVHTTHTKKKTFAKGSEITTFAYLRVNKHPIYNKHTCIVIPMSYPNVYKVRNAPSSPAIMIAFCEGIITWKGESKIAKAFSIQQQHAYVGHCWQQTGHIIKEHAAINAKIQDHYKSDIDKGISDEVASQRRALKLGELDLSINKAKEEAGIKFDLPTIAAINTVLAEEVSIFYEIFDNEIREERGFKVKFSDCSIMELSKLELCRVHNLWESEHGWIFLLQKKRMSSLSLSTLQRQRELASINSWKIQQKPTFTNCLKRLKTLQCLLESTKMAHKHWSTLTLRKRSMMLCNCEGWKSMEGSWTWLQLETVILTSAREFWGSGVEKLHTLLHFTNTLMLTSGISSMYSLQRGQSILTII
jgi:hypothetical protein